MLSLFFPFIVLRSDWKKKLLDLKNLSWLMIQLIRVQSEIMQCNKGGKVI